MELVRSIFAAWEATSGRPTGRTPRSKFVIAYGPTPGSWTGRAGMAEGTRSWLSAWEDARAEAEEYREIDNERILVLIHSSGRGKTSGLELGQMWTKVASLFHVRGDKVIRLVLYFDRGRALADAGVPSGAGSGRS